MLSERICPFDFINKSNTCYANPVLQILSVMPPMLQTISVNMAVKKDSTKPIDQSNFFWALKRTLWSTRVAPFDFNSQQNMAEILQVVLNELKGVLLVA